MSYDANLYPNVIKIQTLTGTELNYYTTDLGDVSNAFRQQIVNNNDGKEVDAESKSRSAYGLMSASEIQSSIATLGYSSTWKESGDKGLFTNPVVGVAQTLSERLIGNGNLKALTTGFLGQLNVTNKPSILDSMGQISSNIGTGPSTIKRFDKFTTSMDKQFTISWYMPDQFNQATTAINEILYMMSPIPVKATQVTDVGIADIAGLHFNKVASGISIFKKGVDAAIAVDRNTSFKDALINSGIGTSLYQYASFQASFYESLGFDYHIDPLPVSVQFGNIIYIEPVVITGVDINCSKEKFNIKIGSKYYQLPLKVSVKVKIAQWMNVPPAKSKVKMLGEQIIPFKEYKKMRPIIGVNDATNVINSLVIGDENIGQNRAEDRNEQIDTVVKYDNPTTLNKLFDVTTSTSPSTDNSATGGQ